MKKIFSLSILAAVSAFLAACSMTIPTCNDELNECGRDSAYTEERTIKANRKAAMPAPAPEPAPEPVIMPAPEPMPAPPAPEPVVDTQVMRSAEPMVQHISK